jgi:hypothetical protein
VTVFGTVGTTDAIQVGPRAQPGVQRDGLLDKRPGEGRFALHARSQARRAWLRPRRHPNDACSTEWQRAEDCRAHPNGQQFCLPGRDVDSSVIQQSSASRVAPTPRPKDWRDRLLLDYLVGRA